MTSTTRAVLSAMVAVALVAGCGSGTGSVPAARTAPAPTTSAAPAGISPAEYQTLLTTADTAIAQVADKFVGTFAAKDFTPLTTQLAEVLSAQALAIDAVVPPVAVTAQHMDVVAKLRAAARLATSSGISTEPTTSCGLPTPVSPSELQSLSTTTMTTSGLTTSIEAVKAKGFTFGSFVALLQRPLPSGPEQTRRAKNGEIVSRTKARGGGKLKITNADDGDVAIAVMTGSPPAPQVVVYVQAGATATISAISGGYEVHFKTGEDWDAARKGFNRDCGYQKFDEPFGANQSWEIELEKSVGGNATTSDAPAF